MVYIYCLYLGIFLCIKILVLQGHQKKQKKNLKNNIKLFIIIYYSIKMAFPIEINLKQELGMNGMLYRDVLLLIMNILKSLKLYGVILVLKVDFVILLIQ